MTSIQIRGAAPPDAVAIAAIHNEGIRGRMATFETTERILEQADSDAVAPAGDSDAKIDHPGC